MSQKPFSDRSATGPDASERIVGPKKAGGKRPFRPSARKYVRLPRSAEEECEIEALFENRHQQTGISFDQYEKIEVSITPNDVPHVEMFEDLQLHPSLTKCIELSGYTKTTPIQKFGIPVVLKGYDLMACAQTGSGKTAAFLIPIIQTLLLGQRLSPCNRGCITPYALIIAPTRELASQIYDDSRKFTYQMALESCVAYGGTNLGEQIRSFYRGCEILVGTPGRLFDLNDRKILCLNQIQFLVLDEADRMLDMGFQPQIMAIIEDCGMPDSTVRQTMLYSATFPREIQFIAQQFLKPDFYLLTVGRVGSTTSSITQQILRVDRDQKMNKLLQLLFMNDKDKLRMIFVERKQTVDDLHYFLEREGVNCVSIHGGRSQEDREMALMEFKSGQATVLVATDVASRGLDIPNVSHVIQYNLPSALDDYIHRIGRTGRAGNLGTATAFFSEEDVRLTRPLRAYLQEHDQIVPDWLFVMGEDQRSQARGRGRGSPNQSNAKGVGRGGGDRRKPRGRGQGRGKGASKAKSKEDDGLMDDWEMMDDSPIAPQRRRQDF